MKSSFSFSREKDKNYFDFTLLLVVLALVLLGLVMIYSASSFKAQTLYGDSHLFLKKQMIRVLIGLGLMFMVMQIDYQLIRKVAPFFLVLSFMALIFVLVSPSESLLKGSRRWIEIKGFIFQPSELAKYALVLFLAFFLSKKENVLDSFLDGLLPALLIISLVVIPIMLEPNMGTSIIVLLIALTMLFIAGAKLTHLTILGSSALLIITLLAKNIAYQKTRIVLFLNTLRGIQKPPWQVSQSLISLGNGGFFGVGLGNSKQKLHFLPQPFTDFIFSILGEELGFIGTVALLILFLILMWRGIQIAILAPDRAGMLLAIGITFCLFFYFLFNVGVAVNLLPVTGLPLPFISYGGSSLAMNLMGVGILLNISSQIGPLSRRRLTLYRKHRKI